MPKHNRFPLLHVRSHKTRLNAPRGCLTDFRVRCRYLNSLNSYHKPLTASSHRIFASFCCLHIIAHLGNTRHGAHRKRCQGFTKRNSWLVAIVFGGRGEGSTVPSGRSSSWSHTHTVWPSSLPPGESATDTQQERKAGDDEKTGGGLGWGWGVKPAFRALVQQTGNPSLARCWEWNYPGLDPAQWGEKEYEKLRYSSCKQLHDKQ